jgi:uncharacterized protein YbjT (DUF2867 family)
MAGEKTILITGATGKQGGATIRHLARRGGFKLRAMTRKPDGDAAKALAKLGAEVVAGDLNDVASLERAVKGAWGVFAVQNGREAGVEGEEAQGKRLAKVAKDAGVQHYVYTSVGSAERRTGVPHFDNKARIEETVKELGFPSHVILRPVFFMENLTGPGFLNGDKLNTTLRPETKLQMVAVDDIGKFGATAFAQADKFKGAEIEYAGDAVTMPEAAKAVSELTGKKVTYQPIPIAAVRAMSDDFAKMLEWFDAVGYGADIPSLESRWGIRPMTLAQWVRGQKN